MKHAREDYNRFQDPENKIPENEPVFLLRGQDDLAPGLLRRWAEEYLERGGDEKMARAVQGHAVKMVNWQHEFGSKLPDLPTKGNKLSNEHFKIVQSLNQLSDNLTSYSLNGIKLELEKIRTKVREL